MDLIAINVSPKFLSNIFTYLSNYYGFYENWEEKKIIWSISPKWQMAINLIIIKIWLNGEFMINVVFFLTVKELNAALLDTQWIGLIAINVSPKLFLSNIFTSLSNYYGLYENWEEIRWYEQFLQNGMNIEQQLIEKLIMIILIIIWSP